MNIVILGGPESGKNTRAEILSKKLDIKYVKVEDILDKLYGKAYDLQEVLSRKDQISDAEVSNAIFLELMEDTKGFVLVGYPTTHAQAKSLDAIVKSLCKEIDLVISVTISDALAYERSKDSEEIVDARLDDYTDNIREVLAYYKAQGKLKYLDGSHTPEDVFSLFR